MPPDIIELFKSVCEKMRKADYVEARSDMLQALERFECGEPQTINWIKCSDRMPEIDVESIEMGEPENNDVLLRTFSTSHELYYYELVTPSELHDRQISEFMEWMALPQPTETEPFLHA